MEVHEIIDRLLSERHQQGHIVKIKSIGDHVMMAGPFGGSGGVGKRSNDDNSSSNNKSSGGNNSSSAAKEEEQEGHGSSSDPHQLLEASLEVLNIALEIQELIPGGTSAGIHVGDLVGAVLGSSRLCFDVFGDTVNTASRVLPSGKTQKNVAGASIFVSSDFYETVQALKESAEARGAEKESTGRQPVEKNKNNVTTTTTTTTTMEENYKCTYSSSSYDPQFGIPFSCEAKGKGALTIYPVVGNVAAASSTQS